MHRRTVLMVSHANPADNDAAAWLAAKLNAAGYQVWVDVEKLRGGETMWEEIERVIEQDALRIILLLSRAANVAEGVSREIGAAHMIERQLGVIDFIIPCVLDDLPFSGMKHGLGARTCIPCQSWSSGLRSILEKLESIAFPRQANPESSILKQILIPSDLGVDTREVVYETNRVAVASLPANVYANALDDVDSNGSQRDSRPMVGGRELSFTPQIGRAQLFGRDQPLSIATKQFLAEGWPDLAVTTEQAARLATWVLNDAFRAHLTARGLAKYELARFNPIFFFNSENAPQQKLQVRLPELSRPSYKHVWGQAKSIFWHLGMESRFLIREERSLILLPHLVFTSDGALGRLDADERRHMRKMHRARRRLTTNWWNQKWRGLNYAFLAWLSGSAGEIRIDVGEGDAIRLSSSPQNVVCPVDHASVGELFRDIDDDDEDETEDE